MRTNEKAIYKHKHTYIGVYAHALKYYNLTLQYDYNFIQLISHLIL